LIIGNPAQLTRIGSVTTLDASHILALWVVHDIAEKPWKNQVLFALRILQSMKDEKGVGKNA